MKQWLRNCTKSTIRLTFSYLAILVTVSIAYSMVMYSITARELVLQIQSPNGPKTVVGKDIVHSTLPAGVPVMNGKKNLAQNLILLNIGAVVLGMPFCYFLARRTLKPIEQAMDNQSRFSSDAAHELRTPVAALRVRGEVALRDPNLTLAQAKAVINSGVEQTMRLEKLSEALLQLSYSSKASIKAGVHLEDTANEAINMVVQQAQAKNITISDNVSDITVMANRQDLVQTLCIFLDNAIKYSPEGSTITITSGKDAKRGYISVEDQGQGIRASDIPRIFERFYRADHARSSSATHSYGLGLSIAQKLMAQNSGTIQVESRLDQGSVFTISLPRA